MALPRSSQVSLEATPYYHCISRCVRKSFLCGEDLDTGVSYEHRRQWIEENLLFLSEVFAIEICAYSILHNHYHTTLHINVEKARALSDSEVVERWHRLYKGTEISRRYAQNESLSPAENTTLQQLCKTWRERLYSISWFMRCSNEPIARRANKEDDCTGHFWEGRYKCKPVLDYKALMATMVYNELNPIKAGVAEDIPSSQYTSIARRIKLSLSPEKKLEGLMPFADDPKSGSRPTLPFTFDAYLAAVNWSANDYLRHKNKVTPEHLPKLIKNLGLGCEQWLDAVIHFEQNFKGIIGTKENVRKYCSVVNKHWMHGINKCEQCFTNQAQESSPLMSKILASVPMIQR